jgi:hypothetical protein
LEKSDRRRDDKIED